MRGARQAFGLDVAGRTQLASSRTETLVRSIDIGLLAVGFGLVHIYLQDQEMAVALGMRQWLAQGARETRSGVAFDRGDLATGSPAGNRPPTPLVTMVSPTLMSALAAR